MRVVYTIHITAILILISTILTGQERFINDYKVKQYTIDDGLPSNECHVSLQDSLGYIWIATDRGLSRFDGYGFKNYGIQEGLEDLSCLQMQLDVHGVIWLRTFSNKFYKYLAAKDSIVAYEFNDKLLSHNETWGIQDFYAGRDTLYVSVNNKGIVKLDRQGKLIPYISKLEKDYQSFLVIEDQVLTYNYNFPPNDDKDKTFFEFDNGAKTQKSILHYELYSKTLKYRANKKVFGVFKGFAMSKSEILYFGEGYVYQFDNFRLDTIFTMELIEDLALTEDNKIITANLNREGVKVLEKSISGPTYSILPNVSASDIFVKANGDILVTTLDEGFFTLKQPDIKTTHLPEFHGHDIINIQAQDLSHIYINVNKSSVICYNLYLSSITRAEKLGTGKVHQIFVDFEKGLEFASSETIGFFKKKGETEFTDFPIGIHESGAKSIRKLDSGNYLILTPRGFSVCRNFKDEPIFNTNQDVKNLDALDVLDYTDGYLVGGRDGLYHLKAYDKLKLDSIHSFFNYRINTIERIGDNYFLGSLGGGVAIWDGQDSVKVISKSDGLISNNVERLVTDTLNKIIVCTKYGMSKIDLSDNMSIRNYTTKHGLPSNQINDATFVGDTLLIATANGLACMVDESKYLEPQKPILERLLINNTHTPIKDELDLNHDQNAITIEYKALDYSQDGDILYSYQINEGQWIETKETKVDLASLQPGNYIFNVRSSNRDAEWSVATVLSFNILYPWWRTYVFYAGVLIFVAFITYSIFKNRVQRIQNKADLEADLRNLEKAALQAQMNPHFIFNCLNSIQSFIMDNDKEQAMNFLAKFAQLIRGTLNASVESKNTIQQEKRLLDNYLSLEQLRLNNKFQYEIIIDDNIDQVKAIIPSMLIQPFVENAVIHGMRHVDEHGIIRITMRMNQEQLLVTVYDNGQKLKDEHSSQKNHKSLGTSITQKRLAYINQIPKSQVSVVPVTNDQGTEVQLVIQL